ncbi:hypothetical protein LLEC1_06455 [Akanthomyces lecanii]|uniref:Calcineurin-like phosphoesterase domain-containing protein n=1 Tax=Cordyceps confragosa TaxID=2714763 RepID=A0A179ID38_CORDF|nr:hypothetical protein LLEC1_06455 [Akanthomyces lecanii]
MKSLLSRLLHRSWYSRIQILSDLHLEIGQQYASFTFPATAPYLLLAGDIGRLLDYHDYLSFLQAQTARFEVVFLVLGNHEFYGLTYEDALAKAGRLMDEPALDGRFVLLDKTRWDSPRSSLSILGCTLWSFIPDDKIDIVQSRVKDFKRIGDWTPATHNSLHAQEAAWLRSEVANLTAATLQKPRNVLVVTHHAPCIDGTSQPEHAHNTWSSAFATEMLASGDWSPVKTWVFGHTHYSTDTVRNGVRIVANQRGYVMPLHSNRSAVNNNGSNYFDPAKVIIN